MPRLTIDNQQVEVPEGASVLDAARALGIDIPALCYRDGVPPNTSCMTCLVRVNDGEKLLPACGTRAVEGMTVESETEPVRRARRAALELLLGDHLGDCIAPCEGACPAGIDIPSVIRRVAAGRPAFEGALPCEACDAPCERTCRRGVKDEPVAIRLLMSYAARAAGAPVDGARRRPGRPFSVHVGRVSPEEIDAFMVEASPERRVEPADGAAFTSAEAEREAGRCLHCDCRAKDGCKLRDYSALLGARPGKYRGARRPFEQHVHPQNVVYEPGKCINCGLCIQIAREMGEPLGLTFIGRGFDVRVSVPFDRPLAEGLERAAAACVEACPTGALAFRVRPEEARR